MKMVKLAAFAAVFASASCFGAEARDSGTTFAKDALGPWVEKGELPGAISVFYKDGLQEVACVGYADVAAKRQIAM